MVRGVSAGCFVPAAASWGPNRRTGATGFLPAAAAGCPRPAVRSFLKVHESGCCANNRLVSLSLSLTGVPQLHLYSLVYPPPTPADQLRISLTLSLETAAIRRRAGWVSSCSVRDNKCTCRSGVAQVDARVDARVAVVSIKQAASLILIALPLSQQQCLSHLVIPLPLTLGGRLGQSITRSMHLQLAGTLLLLLLVLIQHGPLIPPFMFSPSAGGSGLAGLQGWIFRG